MLNVKRKGVSLIEVIILLIVLGVTLGAVFTTMAWGSKSYIFNKQDKESRELLFSWAQTFESLWPTDETNSNDASSLTSTANEQAQETTRRLGGNVTGTRMRIKGYDIAARPTATNNGKIDLLITISTDQKAVVNLTRSYNIYTTETVSDDVLTNG